MAKKIKIGVDIRDLRISKTGARTYLEEICREFSKEEDVFDFVFLDTSLPVYTGKNKLFKLVEHTRFFVWKQCVLPLKAIFLNCDIIFCTDYFVPYFHPNFITIPVFHDAFFWEYPQHYNRFWLKIFHGLGIAAAKRSPYIVTPTKYARKQIALFSGLSEEKIIPILEAPKTITATLGEKQDIQHSNDPLFSQSYLLHIGTFEKRKNLSILIEAFDMLLQNGYPELKLVLIGQASPKKDMDDSNTIHQMICEKKLENKILLPGYVNNDLLHLYYKHAALYVFPSLNEGFGLPVLEAFSYRVPVIIANNSCLPEIAGDGAIAFDPGNAAELSQKIKQVLDDKSMREQLIEKASVRLSDFSWQKTATELKALFYKAYTEKNGKQ